MFKFKDNELARKIIGKLKEMNLNIRLMHACGTHQDTLIKSGLNSVFNNVGIEIRQGPGCPICVTPVEEIEQAVALSKNKKNIITAFGDTMKVRGYSKTLFDMRGEGYDTRIVYSINDSVKIAKENPNKNVIFLAVGFETTAPGTASVLKTDPPENFYVLSSHRYFPPALDALLSMGELKLDGLIQPGHVSVITGLKPYRELLNKFKIPQVVSGFEPLDMIISVYMIAKQIKENRPAVENEYKRAVKENGNLIAQKYLNEVFKPMPVKWRGFPEIPNSLMVLKDKFKNHDAKVVFEKELEPLSKIEYKEPKGCRCSEILRGLVESYDCKLFGKQCTPEHPVGPCMVSVEGNCNINYRYSNIKRSF